MFIIRTKFLSFLTIDDKAKIPLRIAAATKQAPILMNLEYQVRLPGHTFSVGNKQKLIPSVIGLCTITPHKFREALNYIGKRSMKHDTTNVFTHAKDFHSAIELKCFKDHVLNKDGKVKPILFFATGGGADENLRFPGKVR